MLLTACGDVVLRRQACMLLKVMRVIHHVDASELKSRLNISDRGLYHLVEEKAAQVIREMRERGYPIIDYRAAARRMIPSSPSC
jgi:uncharacterized protein (TIGR04552 family)